MARLINRKGIKPNATNPESHAKSRQRVGNFGDQILGKMREVCQLSRNFFLHQTGAMLAFVFER